MAKVVDETTLGGRLLKARKARHLGQVQAGILLGVTHGAVGQWERNETLPDLANLVSAAEHYHASLDWLVWGGEMGSGIESRLRGIPDILRPGLIQRLHDEIDKTEEAARRLPEGMSAKPVSMTAPQKKVWSAKEKQKAVSRAKIKGGTQ